MIKWVKQQYKWFLSLKKLNRFVVIVGIISIIGLSFPLYNFIFPRDCYAEDYNVCKQLLEEFNNIKIKQTFGTEEPITNKFDEFVLNKTGYTLDKIIELGNKFKKYAKTEYDKGIAYFSTNNYGEALNHFLKAYEFQESVDINTIFYIAASYGYLNNFSESLIYFNKLDSYEDIISENGLFDIWYNKGAIYMKLGDYPEAINYFNRTLSIRGDNAYVYFGIGKALFLSDHKNESIYYFEKALSIDNNHYGSWHFLGNSYIDSERYYNALIAYDNALRLSPDSEVDLFGKSWVYYNLENYNESLVWVNRVLEINPNNQLADDLKNAIICKMTKGCVVNIVY